MTKYIIFSFSIVFFFVTISSWWEKQLKITFCDVGQGDATLISVGSTQLLIDAGPNQKVLTCLENQLPFWDRKIEFFILTHMDADHIGGAPEVLSYYQVDYVFMNPSNKKTSDFALLEEAVSRKMMSGTRRLYSFIGQSIVLDSLVSLTVINPNYDFPQVIQPIFSQTEAMLSDANSQIIEEKLAKISENNLSIALLLTYKKVRIILPGDLEKDGELAVMPIGLPEQISILKAGHHGSKSSSTPGFISLLRPEITVISSGKNNAYGHPNPQVINTFRDFGVSIYQTSNSGDVTFVSDGYHFWEIKRHIFW
ncbi:MAG: metallo beta-lactamase superfamily lipoprotein [Patescibacteria group bacterium]|nr:MAG: metallo beta-lactamase superfamily lipoprotein [Patescibacteria group bacterium]